jgi:hypothetical protein
MRISFLDLDISRKSESFAINICFVLVFLLTANSGYVSVFLGFIKKCPWKMFNCLPHSSKLHLLLLQETIIQARVHKHYACSCRLLKHYMSLSHWSGDRHIVHGLVHKPSIRAGRHSHVFICVVSTLPFQNSRKYKIFNHRLIHITFKFTALTHF